MVKCCFCEKEIPDDKSHNPEPVKPLKGNRCCEDCNNTIVIPARIDDMNK